MTPDALRRLQRVSDQMRLRDLARLGALMRQDAAFVAEGEALSARLAAETAVAPATFAEAAAAESYTEAVQAKRRRLAATRAALADHIGLARAGARRAHGRAEAIERLLRKALAEVADKAARREEQTLSAITAVKAAMARKERLQAQGKKGE